MAWSSKDNKQYRGKLDRIYVAGSEPWEVDYFVDHYLKTHSYDLTDENRAKVGNAMAAYPAHAPWRRDELTQYLNGFWKK